jgi:hypothetical protein
MKNALDHNIFFSFFFFFFLFFQTTKKKAEENTTIIIKTHFGVFISFGIGKKEVQQQKTYETMNGYYF